MSDEAHFPLSGFVNKQNFRYWSATNPTELRERPLHSSKVTGWCAISTFGMIGSYFFEDERERAVTVTGPRDVHMLENFLGPELAPHPVTEETFFQQDGATSHTQRDSMPVVRNLFPNHVISRYWDITWPARSPDFSACDFFLWGYLKSQVFKTPAPHTVQEMKHRIQHEVKRIPVEMLKRNGGRLYDVIFGK